MNCPWDSSIDFNTAAQTLSLFQSILLSLGQSINHGNALYISNYYINTYVNRIMCAHSGCSRWYKTVVPKWPLHDYIRIVIIHRVLPTRVSDRVIFKDRSYWLQIFHQHVCTKYYPTFTTDCMVSLYKDEKNGKGAHMLPCQT